MTSQYNAAQQRTRSGSTIKTSLVQTRKTWVKDGAGGSVPKTKTANNGLQNLNRPDIVDKITLSPQISRPKDLFTQIEEKSKIN